MQILRFILKHPVTILILMMLIVLLGLHSFLHIPIEIRPLSEGGNKARSHRIQITAYWPGQAAEIIQKSLTSPIEENCVRIRDLVEIRSSSADSRTYVTLSFPDNKNKKYYHIHVREKIWQLQKSGILPNEAEISIQPLYDNDEERKQFAEPFLEFQVNGPFELNHLRQITDETIVPHIQSLEGVGEIKVFGGSAGYLAIHLNPDKMVQDGLMADEISALIQKSFSYQGLGRIRDDDVCRMLLFDNRPQNFQQLLDIQVRAGLSLKNIADISYEYQPPMTLSRRNGMALITVQVFKKPYENALTFSKTLKQRIGQLASEVPDATDLIIIRDQSEELQDELRAFAIRFAIIMSVIFLILFLVFRKLYPAFIVLIIVFLTLCATSIFLFFSASTINILTLAGIALVLGMVVDNAVVIIENIQQNSHTGKRPTIAALRGTLEVFSPLLASSATTLFVFFSLLFLVERLGNYYHSMAYVLGFTLLSSLLISFVFVPAAYLFRPAKFQLPPSRNKSALTFYPSLLSILLKFPKLSALLALSLLTAVSWFFFDNIESGANYQARPEKQETKVYITAPKGVTMETLDAICQSFENIVFKSDIPTETQSAIDQENGWASLRIRYADTLKNAMLPYLIEARLIGQAVDFAGVGISISGFFPEPYSNGGYKFYTNYNTLLKLSGPNYDKLWQLSENIIELAKADPRVGETIITPSQRNLWSLQSEGHTHRIAVDLNTLWEKGVSIQNARYALFRLFPYHFWQSELIIGGRSVPVKISASRELPELDAIQKSRLYLGNGQSASFAAITQSLPEKKIQWIDKKNQQYQFTLAWNYRGTGELNERHVYSLLQSVQVPPGYTLEKENWTWLTGQEKSALNHLIFYAALGVFLIMSILYNSLWKPFVIFLSVPFSLIGVFLLYLLTARTFSADSYIGIILLIGIVVNDAIVLVERISQLETKSPSLQKAILQAALERIRPIFITTITTIGALLPLLFLKTGNTALAGILEELSFIMIGGLISSTLFTISIIPVFYHLFHRLFNKKHHRLQYETGKPL
jgi:hydrophobic/amphiphilic exporter-1 (mainly G- bacteria), HAE1 family